MLPQVTFIGAMEFDKRRIWFFASLFESRVLFITLDGEMGLLMDFSDNPNFVLSVGGFHPHYRAPALPFPSPRRIALNIINESFARVRVEGYFAVTSNSVQFGSRTEMFLGFDALSVEGYLSFDALLQFSPFYFIVEIAVGFSVKVFGPGLFGVHLRGSLEGPAPWRVRGSASISLLFFIIFLVSEHLNERKRRQTPPEVDQFSLETQTVVSPEAVGVRPNNTLCLVRDYGTLGHLNKALGITDTDTKDLVVMTVRVSKGPHTGAPRTPRRSLIPPRSLPVDLQF